jgi:hypothetical protein
VSLSERGLPIQFLLSATLRERLLLLGQFSAPYPPRGHAPPYFLVLRIA